MSAFGSAAEHDFRRGQTGNRIHPETSSVVVPRLGTVKRPSPEGAPVVVTCFGCSRYVFVLGSNTAIYWCYNSATARSPTAFLQI